MSNSIKPGKCFAVLGTGSDVGKSVVVTALCRIFKNRGIPVAPFKAQNMSNNSFVTIAGDEMGRAQVVQAQAAGIEPDADMNPVLLKPCSDTGSQVVLHGKSVGYKGAREYFRNRDYLREEAMTSLERLRSKYDLIIMEGAGSCGEVNLRDTDFVNFQMAHAADAPVVLVADIDRGGVFAQIIGTLDVIPFEDRKRIKGIVINRFRGDITLFQNGIDYIENRTALPVLGVIPFFRDIEIESEDSLAVEMKCDPPNGPDNNKINIAVLKSPHISNFTDFSSLEQEPAVNLHYLSKIRHLDGYNIVLLPGSKNVRYDMEWLRKTGWIEQLYGYVKNGGEVGGICGGYQMLGKLIRDPEGVEGVAGETKGLALLDMETTLMKDKSLHQSSGIWASNSEPVEGYEIHMGETKRGAQLAYAIVLTEQNGTSTDIKDGAISQNGRIWGTYLHGLFDKKGFRLSFLKRISPKSKIEEAENNFETLNNFRNRQYDLLAEHFKANLDMDKLIHVMEIQN